MGKNAGHKAMQAQRYASSGAGGGEDAAPGAPPTTASVHQEADVTYHTPEWHAARIAALTVRFFTAADPGGPQDPTLAWRRTQP
jgi:hypothetical protein